MSVPRWRALMTSLGDGRVLAAGGYETNNSQTFSTTAEVLDGQSDTWQTTAPMAFPQQQSGVIVSLSGDRALLVGGDSANDCTTRGYAEMYDGTTDSWTQVAQSLDGRLDAGAAVLPDGRVIVVGGSFYDSGCNQTTPTANTEIYDPATDQWSAGQSMSEARNDPLVTALPDGRVLVTGGYPDFFGGGIGLTSTEILDPATGQWSSAAPMNEAHNLGNITGLPDGRVLVSGGKQSGFGYSAQYSNAEVYDPVADTWTLTGPMVQQRERAVAHLLPDGTVLVAAGFGPLNGGFYHLAESELFDPSTNTWTRAADLPRGLGNPRSAALADGRLVVNSETEFVPSDSTYVFDPNGITPTPSIHVVGSHIVDVGGNPLVLRGVDYSGPEYMCAQGQPTPTTVGRGIFEGPTNTPTPPAAMTAWGINAVRLPLNEDCWLGINGIDPAYGGASYRSAVTNYVDQLVAGGIVPIVELSGSAPGSTLAGGAQEPMPDADHSIDFWTDVASTFENDGNVVFDLFNEPFPDGNQDTVTAWTCWRDGGAACPDLTYTAVGMQQLVNTVRATGAANLIVLGGVQYSRINAHWLDYEPDDPMHNLAASWHLYPNSYCNTQSCWDAQFGPFLSQAASVATEIGQGPSNPAPCGVDFLDTVMLWLDAHNVGYLAWTWDAWGDCFSLIGNWGDASPAFAPTTPYGRTYHDHLLGIPQPATSVVAAAGDNTAAVSWQPPVDHGSVSISSYQVTPHDLTAGSYGAAVAASGTSVNVGVVDGHTYTFAVTATNGAGTSAPSASSAAVTPHAGLPAPAAATGTASPTTSTTVTTGNDPAATGGTTTQITVPAGTSGGMITVTQGGTSESAPAGYTFGGVQIDVSAPAATPTNPLTLVFTSAMPAGYPAPPDPTALTATDVYRAEGAGLPQAIPACNGAVVDPEPACVQNKQYRTLAGSTYIQVTVLAETASHWNTAGPKPTAVSVSNGAYTPTTATATQGGRVTWTLTGNRQHSVTDSAGLGAAGKPLFDSGAKAGGSYVFQFAAAGTYAYKSTAKGDSFTGNVAIAPVVSHPGASYVIIWAAARMAGYGFDVHYRFKPAGSTKWGSWTAWQNGTANPNATFVPPKRNGTYSFHAALRNASTGKKSGDSPEVQLVVP